MEYQQEMERQRQMIEARLGQAFPGQGLGQAMAYSLMAGGKRIRPILTLEFCRAAGGDPQQALDAACGVEMLHTYSLIHDDLPCMDNDDLRRGKPTCHKVYGECTATLAGDALQSAAFEWVLTCPTLEDAVRARMGLILARAAGLDGMCGGQYLDMEAEGTQPSLEELTLIHGRKTAALLRAACQIRMPIYLRREIMQNTLEWPFKLGTICLMLPLPLKRWVSLLVLTRPMESIPLSLC